MFTQNGDLFAPTAGPESLFDSLPIGNYIIVETMSGLMFKRVHDFDAPGRMYGKITDRAERILNTFMDRPRTTGVLLSGEKGSGKSQLARNISHAGYAMDIPTIIVNAPFFGDGFNNLLASITQPAIVLMDEFEKVYSQDEIQEQVLTLLDGMMTSKKLFVLTVNNKYRVNEHMKNRPGRIFYALEFDGLEPEFIREYCEDNLNDKDEIENVLKISALFKAFNFDMLKAMVEEMNRYKESAFDVIEMLNAKPMETYGGTSYDVTVVWKGCTSQVAETKETPMDSGRGQTGFHINFDLPKEGTPERERLIKAFGYDLDDFDSNDETISKAFFIQSKHLTKVDVEAGKFEFKSDEGAVISLTKKVAQSYDLRQLSYYDALV
jgi:hypothetical protein